MEFNRFKSLFGKEYLYIMGDDFKFKSLEIYDDRNK